MVMANMCIAVAEECMGGRSMEIIGAWNKKSPSKIRNQHWSAGLQLGGLKPINSRFRRLINDWQEFLQTLKQVPIEKF